MNDDKDMPLNPVGDDALEARIVAWVLGEASSFEAEELERLCNADPALRLFERRMRVLHGLIAADVKIGTDAEWKLPEGKRSKITDLLGVDLVAVVDEVQQARKADRSGRRLLLALAACAVISLVAWSMMASIGGVGEKAVAFRAKESVDFLPAGGAGGGTGGGVAAFRPEASSVPQKKPVTSYSRLWSSSPFTTKPAASAAPASDAMASAMPDTDAEALALSDVPADFMRRAKQDSKEVADLQSLAANEPQSPAAPPPPAAREAQLPALRGAILDSEDVLAKREQNTADLDRAPAGPETATRFRRKAEALVASKSVPDITAGNRRGDGTIHRNNIDAILENPNQPAGPNSTQDWAMGGIETGWKTLDEATKTKIEIFTASPSRAAAADGFYAGGDMDADRSADAVTGAFKNNLGKDLKPSEARSKSQTFAFDNLGQMGELAQEIPADPSRFDRQLKLGGELHYGDNFGSTADRIDNLLDLARKDREVRKELGEVPMVGGLFSLRDATARPAVRPAATALGIDGANLFFEQEPRMEESKQSAASDPFASAASSLKSGELEECRKTVDDLRRNLYTAEGHFNLGKYDDAHRAYEDVLRTDPYNKAARRGMEQVAQARADYYRASYDQTRAQLLADVDKAWELSVPQVDSEGKTTPLASMVDKRKSIIVPEIDLKNATVGEAVDLLQIRAVELDVKELDPAKKGFKFSLEKPAEGSDQADVAALRIPELKLENVALGDAIKQVADAAGLEYAYSDAGVTLKPGAKTPKKSVLTLDAMAEVATAAEPFSTFSLHVSDASFKLAKAAMDRGEIPAADSIRPEEFYNAFDYGDPSPANGEPVVCAVEQSAHPAFPQRNLLRVGIKTGSQGRGQTTPLNLTLLLDNSGSMEREDRNAGLANAVQQLSSLLKDGDTITVAGFSRQPRLLADRLPGARAQELNGLIAQTPSEGGTNLEEGLKLSEELAKRQFNPAAQNRIVLFTDGAANLGDARPEALQARVEGLRQQGIAFDAAGFGAEGLNDKLLERLTRNGNGRYYIVDRAEDADANFAKQLAGAFRPAAENVKVQIRFNPARVAKYKLIGFEEHRLKKEDFRNDAVDAAEMAAEEAGNALYQIEVLPQGEGEVGEVSVRFRDAASGQMVERTWTIPYESQAPAFDQAKPAIQLAGLAAFAAEKLRAAPMADAIDLQQLAPVLAKVKARYPNSQPVADLEAMIGKLK